MHRYVLGLLLLLIPLDASAQFLDEAVGGSCDAGVSLWTSHGFHETSPPRDWNDEVAFLLEGSYEGHAANIYIFCRDSKVTRWFHVVTDLEPSPAYNLFDSFRSRMIEDLGEPLSDTSNAKARLELDRLFGDDASEYYDAVIWIDEEARTALSLSAPVDGKSEVSIVRDGRH